MCEDSFPRCELEKWNPAVEARVGPFETRVRFTAISENRNSKKQGTNSWSAKTSKVGSGTEKARRCTTTPSSDVRFLPEPTVRADFKGDIHPDLHLLPVSHSLIHPLNSSKGFIEIGERHGLFPQGRSPS